MAAKRLALWVNAACFRGRCSALPASESWLCCMCSRPRETAATACRLRALSQGGLRPPAVVWGSSCPTCSRALDERGPALLIVGRLARPRFFDSREALLQPPFTFTSSAWTD